MDTVRIGKKNLIEKAYSLLHHSQKHIQHKYIEGGWFYLNLLQLHK